MKTEIEKLNHNGEGIAKVNGKITFVPKTIPGDIVELTEFQEHKNYTQAKCSHIYKESPIRIPVECPYYHKCGGCQLMGLPYSEQLKYKKEKVINILNKYANMNINDISIIKSPKQYNYRNKITLQVKNGIIGLFAHNTNEIIKIESCMLISDTMNQLIKILQENINLQKVNQIIIRESLNKIMIQVIGTTEPANLIEKLSPFVESLYLNNQHLYGEEHLINILGKYQFQISPNSFFQVNNDQTINLYNQIKKYLNGNYLDILDLYCGTGSIGIYVSECCQKVLGIELNPSSCKDANKNIILNNLSNIKIQQGDVGKILEAKKTYDTIIIDPPRSGLDKKTKQTLIKIKASNLIYVSCNPITLARDLNELKEFYDVKEIKLFDMFPNTYHVESVTLLILKNKKSY